MTAQQQSDGPDNTSLAISPAIVVGIVIVAAFFCVILFASLYRFFSRQRDNNGLSSEAFAARDGEGIGINPDAAFWNPNRQRSAAQVTRMNEVRWINNMYAWERGRQARLEAGELRPTTMIAGRRGENKSWDEYTVGEDSSGRESSGITSKEYATGQYYYNSDNPYGRFSSQQRLSHLAPSTLAGRASYLSTGNGNGLLPRHQSALLPPPIHEHPGTAVRRSPPRKVFQKEQENRAYRDAVDVPREVESEPQGISTQPQTPHPRITINDDTRDVVDLRSPEYAEDTNFETVSLHDESPGLQSSKVSVDPDLSPTNFSRLREGHNVTPTHRPSVIVTDDSLPQLQLQFALPPSRSQQTVSSIYEDEGVDMNSPDENAPLHVFTGGQSQAGKDKDKAVAGKGVESLEEYGQDVGGEIPKENIKDMIQEWERANGRYGRNY
ncbi:hypothetical protein H2200_005528 [Cladophialophora chaetospira]|uniref:Uncharacterized protein n=1 Tax=Cladophialophora chaetospira TaxID=386627 RepID=A0AA38XCR7_9EURO|nr:hypothetical protein H2200_005528 [Cladophialophora chaetospira]